MLNKEECENALFGICSSTAKAEYRKVFYELIKEHFEPQPYNFEDLKEGIWVYDSKNDVFVKCNTHYSLFNEDYIYDDGYIDDEKHYRPNQIKFEKNRFYPVQKANEVKEYVG